MILCLEGRQYCFGSKVNLDGDESTVSAYSPLPYGTPQVKLFEARVDPYAAHHTIKLTNLEAKTVGLDYFIFTPVSEFLSRSSSPAQPSSGPSKASPASGPQAPADPGPQQTSGSGAEVSTGLDIQAPSKTADGGAPTNAEQGRTAPDLSPPTNRITQQDHSSESSSVPSDSGPVTPSAPWTYRLTLTCPRCQYSWHPNADRHPSCAPRPPPSLSPSSQR